MKNFPEDDMQYQQNFPFYLCFSGIQIAFRKNLRKLLTRAGRKHILLEHAKFRGDPAERGSRALVFESETGCTTYTDVDSSGTERARRENN